MINSLTLAPKFYTHLLGHSKCIAPDNVKQEIEKIFENFDQSAPIDNKENIRDCGAWVVKNSRAQFGVFTTADTHLYRVRKALKVKKYISENHYDNEIAVPDKYIYFNPKDEQLYAVCKKLNLSNEIAGIESPAWESYLKEGYSRSGQVQALRDGKPKRNLTFTQAKASAELSFLGYTDFNYTNLYFTQDGKLAILDTEPFNRALKKTLCSGLKGYFFDKVALHAQQAIEGIARLKHYCTDPKAMQVVKQIERNNALWNIAKLVTKITLIALVGVSIIALMSKISLIGAVALITLVSLKEIVLFYQLNNLCLAWYHSSKGNLNKLNRLDDTALFICSFYDEIISLLSFR